MRLALISILWLLPSIIASGVTEGHSALENFVPFVQAEWSYPVTVTSDSIEKREFKLDMESFKEAVPRGACFGLDFKPAKTSIWYCSGEFLVETYVLGVRKNYGSKKKS